MISIIRYRFDAKTMPYFLTLENCGAAHEKVFDILEERQKEIVFFLYFYESSNFLTSQPFGYVILN